MTWVALNWVPNLSFTASAVKVWRFPFTPSRVCSPKNAIIYLLASSLHLMFVPAFLLFLRSGSPTLMSSQNPSPDIVYKTSGIAPAPHWDYQFISIFAMNGSKKLHRFHIGNHFTRNLYYYLIFITHYFS